MANVISVDNFGGFMDDPDVISYIKNEPDPTGEDLAIAVRTNAAVTGITIHVDGSDFQIDCSPDGKIREEKSIREAIAADGDFNYTVHGIPNQNAVEFYKFDD